MQDLTAHLLQFHNSAIAAPFLHLSSSLRVCAQVINGISAKRTCILVATLEPFIQACPVEQITACSTTLIWHGLVAADDAVTDGTFALALECADNVALEDCEPVDKTTTLRNS